ncbi:MAG: membrane protein of unknown function [Promethearchaeota archaeon]|nr:MAG: membrane protein of unknown function [Candidatus Lokiarchaeota archaeon]
MVSFEWYEITLFIFLVIYLVVTLVLAALFLKKYFQVRKIEFLYVGLLVLLFSLSNTIQWILSFLLLLIIGIPLDPIIVYAIQGISSLSLIFGFLFFHKLVLTNRVNKKIITAILIIIILIISIIYYTLLFIDWRLIGVLNESGWTALTWSPIVSALFTIANILFFIIFLLFVIQALRSPNKETQLKGKFLFVASVLLSISIVSTFFLDLFQELTYWIVTFSFIHTARILGFIFFYIGFTLPESIKIIFLKEK